jgi:ribosomal protein S18 acetylase RimI-like enzyme
VTPTTMLGVQLRRATGEDALCVAVLATQVFLDTYATDGIRPDLAREAVSNYSHDRFLERLTSSSTVVVLAERAGHLVGFAEVVEDAEAPGPCHARGLELVRLYVQRRAQRTGVGAILLAEAEAIAQQKRQPLVWLGAWSGNANALAFYRSQGYRDAGATSCVIQGQTYENRVLTKALALPP